MIPIQLSEKSSNQDLGIFRLPGVPREGDTLFFREGVDGTRMWKVLSVTWRPDTPELAVFIFLERLDDRRNFS